MTNTMSCGCEIISDNLGAYKIEYCPKHKAVDGVCEALRKALSFLSTIPNSPQELESLMSHALAKAGEKCIP